ncbi:MAG: hypothetical protein D6813_05555 [Calditrichaeota bacterium]|nr:MAG: hypothetical protein D6813_05555 [Calditrichota bacterium]
MRPSRISHERNLRYLNRDPIEKVGGFNLYAMVGNKTVNFIDSFALKELSIVVINSRKSASKHGAKPSWKSMWKTSWKSCLISRLKPDALWVDGIFSFGELYV